MRCDGLVRLGAVVGRKIKRKRSGGRLKRGRAGRKVAPMTFVEFNQSVSGGGAVPEGLSGAVAALWSDARSDWEAAHDAAQEDKSKAGAWVHAYLHRKEGDAENAGYWYARAGRRMPAESVTLLAEWEVIARELLGGK